MYDYHTTYYLIAFPGCCDSTRQLKIKIPPSSEKGKWDIAQFYLQISVIALYPKATEDSEEVGEESKDSAEEEVRFERLQRC